MKIAITGSLGFVGSYAVDFFSREHEIIAYNRSKEESLGNIHYKKWDIQDPLINSGNYDVFIHCAADTGYEKSREEMVKQNVIPNQNVLGVVNNSHCKHFIYVSSSSVYQGISGIIDETVQIDEKNLENSYSYTKYMAEEYIKEHLRADIKFTILRPRAIYGAGDRVLEPNILKHQIFGRLILLGNGKNVTSLTSIENFVESIDLIIKKQTSNFEIYNISDIKTKTMEENYSEMVKKYKLKGMIHIPLGMIKILKFLNKNKISYLIDNFEKDKILNIGKIQELGFPG